MFQLRLKTALTNEAEILQGFKIISTLTVAIIISFINCNIPEISLNLNLFRTDKFILICQQL